MSYLKRRPFTFYFGLVCLVFWLADTFVKIFILHSPSLTLWYSSTGLLLVGIGLLFQNTFLITTMFCALFLEESLWTLDLFANLFLHHGVLHVSDYLFKPGYPPLHFAVTMYHLLLVPAVIVGVLSIKRVSHIGWVGASFFVSFVGLAAYFFPDANESVNCIAKSKACLFYFRPLYKFGVWQQMVLMLCILTVSYILLNYILIFAFAFKKRRENRS